MLFLQTGWWHDPPVWEHHWFCEVKGYWSWRYWNWRGGGVVISREKETEEGRGELEEVTRLDKITS